MRRFRITFAALSVALLLPVSLLVHRALRSVELERQMRQQAVAERVFDEMERALSELLEVEEKRPFEGYGGESHPAAEAFVIGYFQVDPDGRIRSQVTFRSEEREGSTNEPTASRSTDEETIDRLVGNFWRGNRDPSMRASQATSQLPGTTVPLDDKSAAATRSGPALEEFAARKDVSAFDALRALNKGALERQKKAAEYGERDADSVTASREAAGVGRGIAPSTQLLDAARAESELPPMTGRIIDARHVLLYRTVVRDTRGYRQGLLVDVERLGGWLREKGLGTDGLERHASVAFATPFAPTPDIGAGSDFLFQHRFAEPFEGLTARLRLQPLPGSGSTAYVYTLSFGLLAAGLLGLAALYRMVSVVVSYAERRSNFVAAVTHELKTPLTAIRMYGEMLRDGIVPDETKRNEYYRHITVESERLSRLINNVLELSRLEKGTREIALSAGPITPVVREVADLMRPHVEQEGFDLRLEIDPDLPPVRFERDALLQVLFNLIDNAVKYARDGSAREIVIACQRADSGVRVSVRDRGPGVSSRHLGKIFEPFYRGESELTRRKKGTGLGLALVRGLVEHMGARVGGRNLPGGGFAVEIEFQLAVG